MVPRRDRRSAALKKLCREAEACLTAPLRIGREGGSLIKKDGLLVRPPTNHPSAAVFGSGAAVTGNRARARAKLVDRYAKLVGISSRGLQKPHQVLFHEGLEIASYLPELDGLPVDGAHVAVASFHANRKSWLVGLKSDAPFDGARSGAFERSPEYATAVWAERALGRMSEKQARKALRDGLVKAERVWAWTPSGLRRAYRVSAPRALSPRLQALRGVSGLTALVDAESGRVLRTISRWHSEIRASAYDQNPVKTFRNIDRFTYVVDPRKTTIDAAPGATSTMLRNAYFDVEPGREIEAFDMIWVNPRSGRALGTGPARDQFLASFSDHPRISETNTFVHLNRVRDMFLRLDPTFTHQAPTTDGQVRAFVDIQGGWKAGASPGLISFWSQNGASLADDADVIAHEYAHQVHLRLAPNLAAPDAAEGIADFFSAIYNHDSTLSELYANPGLVQWVPGLITLPPAIIYPNFQPGPFTSRREVNNDFRYPEDYGADGHLNSRILSGAWLELHHALYQRFGDDNYYFVPRAVLHCLPMLVPRSSMTAEAAQDGHGIRDAASTFTSMALMAVLISFLAPVPDSARWAALLEESMRVMERRGLI
jgi:hypothetical protein